MAEQVTKKESTIKDFLEVVFRRKWIIAGIVSVATVTVIVLNIREPAIYESYIRLLVKRGESQGVFSQSIRTLTWEEEIASQIELIKSKLVLDRAQAIIGNYLPEGSEETRRINPGGVNSGVISTSNVLWVTYTSGDPVFSRAATNAVAQAYKEYYQEIRTPPEMEDFFIQELQIMQDELDYWRKRKETVETEWGIVDIREQRRNTLQRLERYQTDLDEVVGERIEAAEIIGKLERFQELEIEEKSAASKGLLDAILGATIESMRRKLLDLRIEESELAVKFTDSNRELIKVREQIADLLDMMDREVSSLIRIYRSRYEIILAKERMLQGLIRDVRAETEGYPKKEVELQKINNALDRLEGNYTNLVERHMLAKISLASNPEWTITILSPASPAYQKKTRDYVRMALGPLFSFVIALGFAFFIDNLDHSIKNISEAEESLGLPVLASFPDAERK